MKEMMMVMSKEEGTRCSMPFTCIFLFIFLFRMFSLFGRRGRAFATQAKEEPSVPLPSQLDVRVLHLHLCTARHST